MSIFLNRFAPRPMFLMEADKAGGAGGDQGAGGDKGAGDQGAAAAAAAAAAAGGDKGAGGKGAPDKGTIASGDAKTAGDKAVLTPAKWPETWRQDLAGDDKAYLKTLERYDSPVAVAAALKELRGKVSAGELKAVSAPPENATPEQMTAWKKEQGLPENEARYVADLKLPDGVVPGEADKPIIEQIAKWALANNQPQETVNGISSLYFQVQDQLAAQREEADTTFHDESLGLLAQEWGKELKVNQNYLGNAGTVFPQGNENEAGAWDRLLSARTLDGRVVGDDPAILRGLVALAREAFPAASVVPAGQQNAPVAIAERKATLEGMMGDPRSEYNRGPKAAALQQEYAELVDAELKMKSKAA